MSRPGPETAVADRPSMRGIGLEGSQLAIGRRLANDGDRQDQGGQTVLRR